MKSFVTGGAGFLGSGVVSRLLARGDEVVALARSDESATTLTRLGAVPVRGDISDVRTLAQFLADIDVVFHIAGDYRVGIKESEHEVMFRTNVDGTTIVLYAAITAAVGQIVYVSTVNVFGNTRGRVVDETYERPDRNFLSYYDATKYIAHRVAMARAAAGAPLTIVQPGAVYGPGDHSELGAQIDQAARGKYTIRAFPELGFTMSYVDDVADGVVLAQTKGTAGESYVLGGEVTRLGAIVDAVADLTGHKRARIKVPSTVFRAATPLGALVGRVTGTGPNLHEMIRASKDVTYWATSGKAERELGYVPRSLEQAFATFWRRADCSVLGFGAAPAAQPARRHHCVKYWMRACSCCGVTCAPCWTMLSMSACASAALAA